jgi:phosphatidate cytidylyltransferase
MSAPRQSGPLVGGANPHAAMASAPRPRSGFRWRLISSVVLWGMMLAVVFWLPPVVLYVFLNLVVARALWEFYLICEAKGLKTYKVWGVIGSVALISGGWFFYGRADFPARSYDFDIFILLVFALGVFLRQFPQKFNAQGIETMAVTLFGLIYVAWLCNFITRINFAPQGGRYFVMYLVVVTKFTDIGAYLVGSTVGRHKMIPRISPNKTWEGTVGGVVCAVAASLLCLVALPDLVHSGLTMHHALLLGVLLGVAAVIGDLAESLVKREAGVKDSSVWLPGHGGALDLVDSLLFTAPLLYVYMRLVLH